MARGFWNSFYQGWDAGDKIGERVRTLAQRRDLGLAGKTDQEVSEQYSPEQIAQLRDPAEQSGGQWSEEDQAYKMPDGGLQVAQNTPELVDGAYQTPQGMMIRPTKSYSLGGETRSTAFTPDEIQAVRASKVADVYDQYGDPEKAWTLRSQSLQNQVNKTQLEQAKIRAQQAAAENKVLQVRAKWELGDIDDEQAANELVKITDPLYGDGITHGFKYDPETRMFEVTEMKDNKVIGREPRNIQQLFQAANMYTSPENFRFGVQQGNVELDQKFRADRAKVVDGQFTAQMDQRKDQFDERMSFDRERAEQQNTQFYAGLDLQRELRKALLAARNQGNELQMYQLSQLKQFDAAKEEILTKLDANEITEQDANRKLNRLRLKFGGGGLSEKPAVTLDGMQSVRSEVLAELQSNEEFKKLSPDAKQAKIQKATRDRLAEYGFLTQEQAAPVNYNEEAAKLDKETQQGGRGLQTAPAPKSMSERYNSFSNRDLEKELQRVSSLRGRYADPERVKTISAILNARTAAEQHQNKLSNF